MNHTGAERDFPQMNGLLGSSPLSFPTSWRLFYPVSTQQTDKTTLMASLCFPYWCKPQTPTTVNQSRKDKDNTLSGYSSPWPHGKTLESVFTDG